MSVIIKMGIFMFLMMNWIDLMGALGQGFQQIGFLAGGAGADGADLKPDSIYKNGFEIFTTFWEKSSFKSIGLVLLNLVGLLTVVIAMILTSIEMFMARIEFYTMALITIPLLPFIMLNKFAFLAEKAIGGMFNLAIKLSVISFISAMAIPFMNTFQTKMAAAKDPWTQPALLFQAVLATLVIYFLTKKIPELVTSLLNGQPNLNGAGMMGSPVGLYAKTLDEALALAALTASVSHNHPEGVKGAQAIATSVFLCKQGKPKQEIKEYVEKTFGYNLHRTIAEIRPRYGFDVSCQGSVPEAIIAFLEGNSFEEVIRLAISLGGDSDTIGAMAGSIAACMYPIPDEIALRCDRVLTDDLREIKDRFCQLIEDRS